MKYEWINKLSPKAIMHAYNIILNIPGNYGIDDVEEIMNITESIKSMYDIDDMDKHGLIYIFKSLYTFDTRGLLVYGLKESLKDMYISGESNKDVCISKQNCTSTSCYIPGSIFSSMTVFNEMIRVFHLLKLNPGLYVGDKEGSVGVVITAKEVTDNE